VTNESKITIDTEISKKAEAWLKSKEGQESLLNTFEEVKKIQSELEKARKIPWHLLHVPLCPCHSH